MNDAKKIVEKYNSGTATPAERAIVESWYLKYRTAPSDLTEADLLQEYELGLKKLQQSLEEKKTKNMLLSISIAASLLLCIGLGWFAWQIQEKADEENAYVSTLLPEKNTAILTLSDGRKVTLSEGDTGEIIVGEDLKISQTADGMLVYSVRDRSSYKKNAAYNTIETPTGNAYKIVLPDGSQVFLSSASKLRYPVRFSERERKVELVGEAHFEIVSAYSSAAGAPSSERHKLPFIVKAGNQEVEVLGTKFSVSAYEDVDAIETALMEGAVKVSIKSSGAAVLLKPGQKAVNNIQSAKLRVETVDIQDLKAWKEGYFIFNNENIKDIMKKLARWYGFEIAYVADMTDIAFQGNYLRTRDVSHLLKTMEMANTLEFEVVDKNKERRIVVKRKNY